MARYFCEVTKLDIKLRITTRIKISGKWNWFAKNFYCHKTTCRTYDSSAVPIINMPSKSQVATQCVAHNEEIGCHRLGPCRGGQGGTRSRAPKGPNNVASAFFYLLPKDLRFEHSAPKLFLAPGAIKPRYVPAQINSWYVRSILRKPQTTRTRKRSKRCRKETISHKKRLWNVTKHWRVPFKQHPDFPKMTESSMKQGVVKRSWANYCVWARECDTSNPRYWWDAARYLTYLKFKKNIQRCLNKLRKQQRLSEMHPHVITWTLEIHTAGNERSEDTLQGIEFR